MKKYSNTCNQKWQKPGMGLTNASCLSSSQKNWLPVSAVILQFELFARTVWGGKKLPLWKTTDLNFHKYSESNARLPLLPIPPSYLFLYTYNLYCISEYFSQFYFSNRSCHSAYAFLMSNSSSRFLGRVIGYSLTPRWAAVPSCTEWADTFQNKFMQIH